MLNQILLYLFYIDIELKELIKHPIFVYDGNCGFCNKSVQFILDHEKSNEIYFVSFQSASGKALGSHWGFDSTNLSTAIFIKGNTLSTKSDAILAGSSYLKAPYSGIRLFKIIPKGFRDVVYDFISKNRNKIQMQRQCKLVNKEKASRLIT